MTFQSDFAPAQRYLARLLIATLILQPLAAQAQVVAAGNTAPGARPTIDAAPNGVPVVQIATPNGAGLSHNQYQQFNVGNRGVVLNNSPVIVSTQQAGYITGNPNLTGASARLILNEVTGNLPSTLAGYTEVAGPRAEVIIANPNGITCGGCGFINTSRGMLTTGTPVFGGSGSLDAFRVTGGQITVGGGGLDGSRLDQLDLLARSVTVNGPIWANTLNVVTGANQVSYADLTATPIAGIGAVPANAIDVALLGGMYAGKIRLVATEAGVGVNSLGSLVAQIGDFRLDAAGRVTLGGSVNAAGAIDIAAAQDLSHSGTLYAGGNATLTSGGQIANSGLLAAQGNLQLAAASLDSTGTLAAGLDNQGNSTQAGNLEVATVGTLRAVGQNLAGGDLSLRGTTLDLAGARTSAGGNAAITATGGAIDHTGAILQSGGNLTLNAGGDLLNDGGKMTAGQTFASQSATFSNRGGQVVQLGTDTGSMTVTGILDNRGGMLASNGNFNVTAGGLDNQGGTIAGGQDLGLTASMLKGNGTLLANRDLSINLAGSYTQSAANLILANRNLNFTLTGDLINEGTLGPVGSLSVNAANITNQSGAVLAGTTADITAGQTLSNAGVLSATTLGLNATTLNNTGSVFGRDVTVKATDLTNQGTGVMAAGNSLNLYVTNNLKNLDGGLLYSAGTLSIAGDATRDGNGWLSTPTNYVLNRSASIQAGADLEITATTLDNKRTEVVTDARTLSSSILLVQDKDDAWSGSTVGRVFINRFGSSAWYIDAASSVPTFTILDISDDGRPRHSIITDQRQDYVVSATPESRILAGGNLYLRAGTVNNIASRIEAAGNLVADVGTLNNTGYTLNNTTRQTVWTGACSDIQGDEPGRLGNCRSGWIWTADITDTVTGVNTSLDSVFRGGQSLSLNAVTINNRTIDAQGLPPGGINLTVSGTGYTASPYVFNVPGNGLYTLHQEPTAHYLVETDPRFTRYANFISSDYLLSRLGLNPETARKRLGDGFYEQQLVREQLIRQRGTASLGAYASLDAEYQALLEAGVAYAQAFELVPGVTLTQEQIARLGHDMVWLEARVVDGQSVLVPVVYLVPAEPPQDTGAVIAGGAGTRIAATDLSNTGTLGAGGDTRVAASHDLINDSGTIRGENVTLTAGNDLHLGVATQSVTPFEGQTFTHEGRAGTVEGQTVTLAAGRDLTLAGGVIDAGDATLAAGRDLTVGPQALSTEQHLQNGGSQFDRSATVARGSCIATTGDLTLAAEHDLAVVGSRLQSGGDLSATAGNQLALAAAYEQEVTAYRARSKELREDRQSFSSTVVTSNLESGGQVTLQAGTLVAEGAQVKAGGDIALAADTLALYAAHDQSASSVNFSKQGKGSTQQLQSQIQSDRARGTVLDAGGDLSLTSTGNTIIEGGALGAGQTANITTGGDLALVAAQSSTSARIVASAVGRKEATKLDYTYDEVRQLLTTITVGAGASLQVGGNFTATVGEPRADGTINADRMTLGGVVRGDARQQVSVTRTGDGADANPANSQVLGSLASQGIRYGANESFAPTAANAVQGGSAALQQYVASGLLQVKNTPQLAAALQNRDGATLTYQDDRGKLRLTVAGEAKVQAVYNTLKLTETFDVKKFADQQTAQIVTLVAAVVLTVCIPGAGAALVGATGATTAAMANAAFIAMSSTMIGQLAGGASFDQAFETGLKAGTSAALTAGILNAPVIDTASGTQSLNQLAGVKDVAGTGSRLANFSLDNLSLDAFGQNLAGMAARGVVNAGVNQLVYGKQAGSFGSAFTSSVVSDLAAVGANAVGQSTNTLSLGNVLGHAVVGGLAAGLKGKDAVAGAIGGAAGAVVNPLLDQAIGGADGSGWGSDRDTAQRVQSGVLQLASMGVGAGVAHATGHDGMTAALAAQNETLNNFLTKENVLQKQARLAQAKTPEQKAEIVKEYFRISRANTNKAFTDVGQSVITVDSLTAERDKLQALISGPTIYAADPAFKAEVRNSIAEIDGILRSAKAGENLEPYLLAAQAGLTLVGGAEWLAVKYGLRGVAAVVDVGDSAGVANEIASLRQLAQKNGGVIPGSGERALTRSEYQSLMSQYRSKGSALQSQLDATIAEQDFVYRATTQRAVDIYRQNGFVGGSSGGTYMSTDFVGTDVGVLMDRGQVFPQWGAPEVLLRIPTSELSSAVVPRPLGGRLSVGWEPKTQFYPAAGSGNMNQFLGTTKSWDDAWVIPLKKFGQ